MLSKTLLFVFALIPIGNVSALTPIGGQEESKPQKNNQESETKKDSATKTSSEDKRFSFDHVSADKKFSIKFPAKPNELKQTYKTPVGTIEAKIAVYNGRNESFAIIVSDYPDGHMRANGLDKVLATAKQGTTQEIAGKLSNEKAISIDKYKGHEFVISTNDEGKQLHVRQIIVGDRLYQIMVGNSVDNSDDSLVTPFMDSFKLL